jgi:plastocyanin
MRALLPLALLVLASPAAAQPDWSHAQSVEVQLSNFAFAPDHLRLPHGEAIVLHLVNNASGGHNFAAPEFFAAATIAPDDAAKIQHGAVELRGHQSVDIHLVAATGHYHLHCSHTMHTAFGMSGEINVE